MAGNNAGNSATRAKNKYNSENYDSLRVVAPKGKKAVIKEFAQSKGKSLNKFVNEAIDEKMERDK
jgi:predicted HicB family RNase H-like nuclease